MAEFDIQVLKDGRWVTDAVRASELDARALARTYLKNKRCPGARVVDKNEKVIFAELQEGEAAEKPVRIVPIDTAQPYCTTARDFFGLESRITLNRLFREYLEQVTLTPIEVLHNHRELERLFDRDSLLLSSVSHVAKLQAKQNDISVKDRQKELNELIDQITEQAKDARKTKLPKLTEKFSDILRAVRKVEGNTPEYWAMVVLTRELVGIRNWIGKLELLCKLVEAETDEKTVLLLDTVIADVLGANVMQELLGWQPSLGSAIISMIDMADGIFDTEKSDAQEMAARLQVFFADDILPASRRVLIDRALKHLKSSAPLYKSEPSKEMAEYQKVLARLMVPGGILSGASAADAITSRSSQFMKQGGATGRRNAIKATVKVLPDPARGAMYLSELTKTEFADDHLTDIVTELDIVFSARVIDELCRRASSPKDRMITATGAFSAAASSALPDDVKNKVTEHIDGVLERYLIDENIIDKLDNKEVSLRDRAVRLVKFCSAGVLPEGKALALARKRVVKILKQPGFDAHFIEGITEPKVAEKTLRDFHKLLIAGGFA